MINPSISFFVQVDSVEETERLFETLAEGRKALMPFDTYPWSERYAWVADRYGVSWQLTTSRGLPDAASVFPCLMFAGAQHGRAHEAMQTYGRVFPGERIDTVEHYTSGEGPVGTVKHARFVLAGQQMVAMDSHIDHGFTFNEAVSLQVMCDNQQDVDRYWVTLSEGGEQGTCGWLKDRFGLSWQVVPRRVAHWMTAEDTAARDRVFQAMLGMNKLDIAALQTAFDRR